MIPVGDSVRTQRFPWVNLLLILASTLVFFYELALGPHLDAFVQHWGATPVLILRALDGGPRADPVLWTLLTSQFIHAGWSHLLGNMLFLWVFGRAVEDRLGHFVYLILYLVWGAGAALAQIFLAGPVNQPLVGASGAISGVLGAYLVMFPGAWVSLLVPIFFFFWVFEVPALLVLAYWFLVQLLNGTAAITQASTATAGIAFWAHVGGFLLGMIAAIAAPGRARSTPPARMSISRPRPRGILWGMASVISGVAHILALFVLIRVLMIYFVTGTADQEALAPVGLLVYAVTTPFVEPFAESLPAMLVDGKLLELFSLAAAFTYWVGGSLLVWAVERISRRR